VAEGRPRDLAWRQTDGTRMTDEQWHDPSTDTLVMALSGELFARDELGYEMRDAAFLIVLNRSLLVTEITLPATPYGEVYRRLLDTSMPRPDPAGTTHDVGSTTHVAARSVALFRVEDEGL
jgi:pullulanase/glycogen debranching enzyme